MAEKDEKKKRPKAKTTKRSAAKKKMGAKKKPAAKKKAAAGKRPAAKKRAAKAGASKSSSAGHIPSEKIEQQIRDRADQLVSIVSKGLDLAEASITLGINMMNRLSSAASEQLMDRVSRVGRTHFGPEEEVPGMEAGHAQTPQGPTEEPGERGFVVVNRLPLFPGGPVRIPFSVNNDSPSSPKQVRLGVEGFIGELRGAELDKKHFSITPATRAIAPMDFEKFTLTGVLPPDLPGDTYSGWIAVGGDEELRIPIRLVVTEGAA
jgi:hypothetical protein